MGINGYVIGDATPVPIGYEKVVEMKTLDFEEFLWALGYKDKQIDELIRYFNEKKVIPDNFRNLYKELFLKYACIGGFPKVVSEYVNTKKIVDGWKEVLSFYYALNTDNTIAFCPVLTNIVYTYVASKDYMISVGKIGKLECDFILRSNDMNYSYVQVTYTILFSKEREDREYRSLESNRHYNYPRYLLTTDNLLQKRNGIIRANILDFIKHNKNF